MNKKIIIAGLAGLVLTGAVATPVMAADRTFTGWFNNTGAAYWDNADDWNDSPDYASAIAGVFNQVSGDTISDTDLAGYTGTLDISDTIAATDLGAGYPRSIELLSGLTSLDASQNHIVNMGFVACMPELTDLNLSGNQISGLDWAADPSWSCAATTIAGLTKLEAIDLSDNNLNDDDLLSLSGLTTLENLNLSGNADLVDITPLSGLTNLKKLNLTGTGVDTVNGAHDAGVVYTQMQAIIALDAAGVEVTMPDGTIYGAQQGQPGNNNNPPADNGIGAPTTGFFTAEEDGGVLNIAFTSLIAAVLVFGATALITAKKRASEKE